MSNYLIKNNSLVLRNGSFVIWDGVSQCDCCGGGMTATALPSSTNSYQCDICPLDTAGGPPTMLRNNSVLYGNGAVVQAGNGSQYVLTNVPYNVSYSTGIFAPYDACGGIQLGPAA